MSSAPDDLPWPELGNVSRGATRGNQGQKGVLGEIGPDGCALLQLRVQPGVLAVRLNRQATEWYKILDAEVNRALKLTKTYWRKARRRQDYDARADQDHMELHEWLQQLKDKTMSHLELLMQKGDIQGPPYNMSDEIELTFLHKFIERQAAGIPHNPRLRNGHVPDVTYALRDQSVGSVSPEPEENPYIDPIARRMPETPDQSLLLPPRNSVSPSLRTPESLTREASQTKQALALSRAALSRAQRETQEAFLRYTACLDAEKQARQSVTAAEKRRDDIMTALLSMNQSIFEQQSRHSSVSIDDHQTRYHTENPNDLKHRTKPLEWTDHDTQNVFAPDAVTHLEIPHHRKHRTWDNSGLEGQYGCEDMLPHRKRLHMMPGYDVLTPVLQAQNLGLQS